MPRPHRWRSLGLLAGISGCGLLAAACGAGAGSGTGTGTTDNHAAYSAALRYANCMRSHGVPDFPDPGATGGLQVAASPSNSDLNPQSPAFEAAAKACRKVGPGLGGPPHPLSAAQRRRLIAFSQCMRTHGVPAFPDPTFPASGGALIGRPQQPGFNPGSPAFKRAMSACGRPLR
jgi:hypothetical protein